MDLDYISSGKEFISVLGKTACIMFTSIILHIVPHECVKGSLFSYLLPSYISLEQTSNQRYFAL